MNFKHCRQVYLFVAKQRIIIHCDLDAFFASVEILHHGFPEDEPLIIGSDPMQGRGRGIVSTCNYAAREYGVRSAMPISEAWRRCPGHPFGPARFIRGTRSLYSMASRRVMKVLRNDSDVFEQASIDEAYMDVTEKVGGDWDEAMALARRLQRTIHTKVGLTASFGIGSTRIVAKMSSEINKPNGIHRVLPDEIQAFFESRSVREVPGIGPKTANVLAEWGITSMDEAVELGELALARMTSRRFASWILRVVEGSTSDEVSPLRSRRSVGKERTFSVDQSDHEHVLEVLEQLTIGVLKKAQLEGIAGRLAEVKIRYTGFETHTHGRSIPVAMDDTEVFLRQVRRLFAENVHQDEKIRLIGFRLGQLEVLDSKQTTLVFDESE
ncbi:MAG: DNA polymerase IV, partial [Candidatus Poseidoniaceae archaeon]|nr:DNA polymerase IV [Candidatus Poseidoniaceae archaeon]